MTKSSNENMDETQTTLKSVENDFRINTHHLKHLQSDLNPKFMEKKSTTGQERKSRYGRVQKELRSSLSKSPKSPNPEHILTGYFRLSPNSGKNEQKQKKFTETLAEVLVKKNREIIQSNSPTNNAKSLKEIFVEDLKCLSTYEKENVEKNTEYFQDPILADFKEVQDIQNSSTKSSEKDFDDFKDVNENEVDLDESLESPDFEIHDPSAMEGLAGDFKVETENLENNSILKTEVLGNSVNGHQIKVTEFDVYENTEVFEIQEGNHALNESHVEIDIDYEVDKSEMKKNINESSNNTEKSLSQLEKSSTDFIPEEKSHDFKDSCNESTKETDMTSNDKSVEHFSEADKSPGSKDSANGSSIDTEIISVKAGELFWAQIGTYPYWPCMISPDPEKKTISYKEHVATKSYIIHHVRFFADNGRRSWVKEEKLLPYNGRESFVQKFSKLPRGAKDPLHKLYKKGLSSKTWDLAIIEADSLRAYPPKERIRKFNSVLEMSRNQLCANKQIRRLSKSSIYDSQDSLLSTTLQASKRERSISTDSTNSVYSLTPPVKKRKIINPDKEKRQKEADFKIFSDSLKNFLCNGKDNAETNERWTTVVDINGLWELFVNSHDGMTDITQKKFAVKISSTREKCLNLDIPSSEAKIVNKREFRSIDEVVDDIFNLGTEYLVEDLTNDIFCKFCKSTSLEDDEPIVKCSKSCGYNFHSSCLKNESKKKKGRRSKEVEELSNTAELSISTEKLICNECQLNENHNLNCFICKKLTKLIDDAPDEISKCLSSNCGKYCHKSCLRMWPQSTWITGSRQVNFVCPSHTCHTCVSDNPGGKSIQNCKTKFLKCVLCPASYHRSSTCIPAGTQLINTSSIVCPRHDQNNGRRHINVDWCFICAEGGQLICCETCPASVHPSCLNQSIPSEKYNCDDCESGRLPLYGELVWVRFGIHRWWPSLILPPTETPFNIRRMKHFPSEFVVRFFGTNDHGWISRSRVYLCQDDDWNIRGSFDKKGSQFLNGVHEAKRIMEIIKAKKHTLDCSQKTDDIHTPFPYVKIKINKLVLPVKFSDLYDEDKVINCNCQKDINHPCGPDTGCLNRSLFIECDPKSCPAGEKCENQLFEKRTYPKMKIKYTKGKGFGLIALEKITSGTFVTEYVGEIIDTKEYHRRLKQQEREKNYDYYFLTLQNNYFIDAGPKGNIGRFMNHSCEPNCETQKWTVRGITRIGLFAIQDIEEVHPKNCITPNTELTFNYMFQSASLNKKVCFCQSSKCSGFIGEKYTERQVIENKKHKNRDSGKHKK
ncbi:NSD1 family protein [Megaselia abdita]